MNHKLDEFVAKLKGAAGENLQAVILYGSAVTGEFHSKYSDLNLLCVLRQADTARVEALRSAVEPWVRQGRRPPLVFTLEELRRSADVFAVELLDMKSHHRVLWGEDVLSEVDAPLRYHSIQIERELRTDWLRLRQAILVSPKKAKARLDLMVTSISAFAALFRHALIALGEPPAATRREAIDRIARWAHSEPAGFHAVLDFREGKRKEKEIDVEKTLRQYFALVEAVTNEFDRQLDARNPR